MVLTRMGFGSSLVINGDLTQIDLPKNIKSGLSHAIEVVEGTEGIGFTRLLQCENLFLGCILEISFIMILEIGIMSEVGIIVCFFSNY